MVLTLRSLLRVSIPQIHGPISPKGACRHKSLFAAIERGSREPNVSRGRWRIGAYSSKQERRQGQRQFDTGESEGLSESGGRRHGQHAAPPTYKLESLPYSTAASEFLYGSSVVKAAIKARRRKLYTLYIHDRALRADGREELLIAARAYRGLKVRRVGDNYLQLMDKASSGRPHNGVILEASPLPRPPLVRLGTFAKGAKGFFEVELDRQSQEEKAINGTETHYLYKTQGWRYPFVLYVDGVLDEGNLGAIARSAYFLGVDAIATPIRQSAPWSHIALKASAGAAEAIPIFAVRRPTEFLSLSARDGWRIYASDAVAAETERSENASSPIVYRSAGADRPLVGHYPLKCHPTLLMMGGEGTGLRESLRGCADYIVGIRAGRDVGEVGVDSLNVSVASALLCFEMLKRPPRGQKKVEGQEKAAESLF